MFCYSVTYNVKKKNRNSYDYDNNVPFLSIILGKFFKKEKKKKKNN